MVSRGSPLVAWAVWRYSLNIARDEGINLEAQEAAALDHGRTIWITPWDKLQLPVFPAQVGQPGLFVLHALLQHDGLNLELIGRILQMDKSDVRQILHRLGKAGLVLVESGMWRVAYSGFSTVRQTLAQQDFLLDQF